MTLPEIEQALLRLADDVEDGECWRDDAATRLRELARRIGLETVREELAHEQQQLIALEVGE